MQLLDIEHFHQRAMFIKVHLDFVQGLQVQLKAQTQRPQVRLATLWIEKRVNLCSNPRFLKKKLKFQLTYGSSNWVSLIAIDFTQSTWFTTSKVNCKNISEFLSKKFPIDFQSPIDFSQLHMIRPLIYILEDGFFLDIYLCTMHNSIM